MKEMCFALLQVVVRSPDTFDVPTLAWLDEALQKVGALRPVLEKDLLRISKLKCRF